LDLTKTRLQIQGEVATAKHGGMNVSTELEMYVLVLQSRMLAVSHPLTVGLHQYTVVLPEAFHHRLYIFAVI
jgi:hypothetical protein